ncbi:MAG: HmuY family protein [Bacteroidetes bacterium]|nr:HmuY family protein [Bacteroidota bacterium]
MGLDNQRSILVILIFILITNIACQKKESPIPLPPAGTAEISNVNMGEDYANQVYFNFSTGKVVLTSPVLSWDIALESSAEGYHVFMNGGKDVSLYNTHSTDFAAINESNAYNVADTAWGFDNPSGLPNSTYAGDWEKDRVSKNEVFILKYNDGSFKKFVLKSVSDTNYTILFGEINSKTSSSISIPKDSSYNYAYFNFETNQIAHPEPPRNSYDLVFTRYRYIYYNLDNTRYSVTGALLNPYGTSGVADSSIRFVNILFTSPLVQQPFSNHRDVIGFNWKDYNFTTAHYDTKPANVYVVKTQSGAYWKLHFLDFYNASGQKGSPTFEYERIN